MRQAEGGRQIYLTDEPAELITCRVVVDAPEYLGAMLPTHMGRATVGFLVRTN